MLERFPFPSALAAKSPTELNRFLGNSLSAETMYLLSRARKKGMPFFVTPYYLHLLNPAAQDTTMNLCAATSSTPRNWWKLTANPRLGT